MPSGPTNSGLNSEVVVLAGPNDTVNILLEYEACCLDIDFP